MTSSTPIIILVGWSCTPVFAFVLSMSSEIVDSTLLEVVVDSVSSEAVVDDAASLEAVSVLSGTTPTISAGYSSTL